MYDVMARLNGPGIDNNINGVNRYICKKGEMKISRRIAWFDLM